MIVIKVMATGTFDIVHPGHGFYLEEAKKLGGDDATLMVVIATDKTVKDHKRVPIIGQEQRRAMVSMLKPVDEVFIGNEGDPFKIVEEKRPDIIAIGPDQHFKPYLLHKQLKERGLDVDVIKIRDYKHFELDSSCKIIRKIKHTHFDTKSFEDCDI